VRGLLISLEDGAQAVGEFTLDIFLANVVVGSQAEGFDGLCLSPFTGQDQHRNALAPLAESLQQPGRYGAKDTRGVSVFRESLIQKGLIWSPRRGQLDFTVPLFAEFLRENHPLASFDDEA
jgi:hypothetical protein